MHYTAANSVHNEAPQVSNIGGLHSLILGTALGAFAGLSAADSNPVAAPVTGMLAPSLEVHAQATPAARAATPAKKSTLSKSAARKRSAKPRVKRAALGTPDLALDSLQSMTEEEALKSLEQEVSLKVGKHMVASDYPAEAQRWRWTGTSLIQVMVGKDGKVREVSLSRSSGFRMLDESALTVVKRVSKLFVPFRLRGREHSVTVPIGFYLRDM